MKTHHRARPSMAKIVAMEPCGYTLDVVATNTADAVHAAGGLIFDRVHEGWTVRVFVLDDDLDPHPLHILGARGFRYDGLDMLASSKLRTALALSSAALAHSDAIYQNTLARLHHDCAEVTLWGDPPPEMQQHLVPTQHRLSSAAKAFKTSAWTACSDQPVVHHQTERFQGAGTLCVPANPDLIDGHRHRRLNELPSRRPSPARRDISAPQGVTMTAPTDDQLARVLADPKSYSDETALHNALARLRSEDPVSWVDQPRYRPFWAITKHADISAIERDDTTFTNAPRPILITTKADDLHAGSGVNTLIHLDGQQHRKIRAIAADWFRPKAMRALQTRIDELAGRYVDDMADAGGECDFVQHIAVKFPLYVIMTLLGIPESDFAFMLKLTQELFGSDDDEYRRPSLEEQGPALLEMFGYFTELTASRRQNPTEDLGSTIANARIDGQPLPDIDTISYYVIVASAGHDTTSATISGGLHALIDNPDQHRALRADPGLQPLATEEMIRWVTPVKAFMRTAARDTKVRGVPITRGDSLLLSYVSANRDSDAFTEPFRFDIARNPNRHLAFGHGVHFCLGAALARMEVSSFFAALLPRLTDIELAGTPEHVATTFVGGLKHLPIRYQLTH